MTREVPQSMSGKCAKSSFSISIFSTKYTLTRENERSTIDLVELVLSLHMQPYIEDGFLFLVTQRAESNLSPCLHHEQRVWRYSLDTDDDTYD